MKKLLLTCLITFVGVSAASAQTAKVKKQNSNRLETVAKNAADKKAKDEALQQYKKQANLDAQKSKNLPKTKTVLTTLASEEIISN